MEETVWQYTAFESMTQPHTGWNKEDSALKSEALRPLSSSLRQHYHSLEFGSIQKMFHLCQNIFRR